MFRARGQPGCYYGYAELDGVTYKIDAKHVGKGKDKHFEGTIKRHLKADQQSLRLTIPATGSGAIKPPKVALRVDAGVVGDGRGTGFDVLSDAINRRTDAEVMRHVKPEEGFDFDDDLPENL
jgi:hypothetical protein